MTRLHRIVACFVFLAIANSATAQPNLTSSQTGPRDSNAQVGIVIPFGKSGSSVERVPRLEVWSEPVSHDVGTHQRFNSDREPDPQQPARLGITLRPNPQMMINGQEVPNQQDRLGVSALGWIGIGVGVVAAAFALAITGNLGINPD